MHWYSSTKCQTLILLFICSILSFGIVMHTLFKVVALDDIINYDSSRYELEMDRERELSSGNVNENEDDRHKHYATTKQRRHYDEKLSVSSHTSESEPKTEQKTDTEPEQEPTSSPTPVPTQAPPYDSSLDHEVNTVPTPLNSRVVAPGFAACLLVLDDTIRLHEWVAYHYTVLPLSSLVIGLDPKTSNDSIAEIQSMAQSWKDVGLNITIWPTNPKRYEVKMSRQENKMPEYQRMQTHFVTSCTHHFIDRAKENWLLLADSDEFLSYNLIKQGEEEESPNSIFQGPTAPSKEKIASDREQALPIREQLLDYIHQNTTILSLIQEQKDNSSQTYFPSISGCTRVVGLAFGTNVTNGNKGEILMTRKYQTHQKALHNRFSKVILELPKIRSRHLTHYETIHNPFPKLCGKNGRFSSGQDFKSSVLRVSHYIGSLESWVERGGGKEFRRAQNVETWEKKNADGGPYEEDQLDTSMGYWFDTFLSKVGKDAGEELLLKPLRNRIDYVRSKQNMSYVS